MSAMPLWVCVGPAGCSEHRAISAAWHLIQPGIAPCHGEPDASHAVRSNNFEPWWLAINTPTRIKQPRPQAVYMLLVFLPRQAPRTQPPTPRAHPFQLSPGSCCGGPVMRSSSEVKMARVPLHPIRRWHSRCSPRHGNQCVVLPSDPM